MSCRCKRPSNEQGVCPHGHECVRYINGTWTDEHKPECCALCPPGVLQRYKAPERTTEVSRNGTVSVGRAPIKGTPGIVPPNCPVEKCPRSVAYVTCDTGGVLFDATCSQHGGDL